MKFMKLGSKPDLFQSKDKNTRYVAAELATDIIINVGNVKFYLHKFPLLSKSAHLQKLVAMSNDENTPEVQIHDIPGGPATFEICAKFCYGMTITLNAYNVASARCAAEYLEMYETIEKGNLAFKIEVFLNSSIFRSWKDSIIVFQTTKSLTPFSEELKVVKRCVDSIVSKVSMDTSRVDWSYSYNRTKLASENGIESPVYNNVRKIIVPKDWWVEDLCDLQVDLFKKIIITIRANKKVSPNVLGESLKAYAQRRLKNGDAVKTRSLIETILCLLPTERNSVSCDFLINLLQESVRFSETRKHELVKRIGEELQNVSVDDLVVLDVDLVREIVKIFLMQDQVADHGDEPGFLEVKFVDSGAKVKVAKLIDCYLAEVAKDRELPVSKFVDLADMVLMLTRSSHDGIYRAIDTFLKEHPGLTKTETKRLCKLMDCRKLSADACMHAVQNERLPLRVVVQVLFFEQIRATVARGSHGSSRSVTTNTEEEWDSVPTSEELAGGKPNGNGQKAKGMVISKRILSKLFSRGDRGDSDDGSSGTSCSTNAEETKSVMPSRSKRH